MSDLPEGFGVRQDLVHRITPEQVRRNTEQILNELAKQNPELAKERRQRRREMKAWQRERQRLYGEIVRLQTPLVIAVLSANEAQGDLAAVTLRVCDFLWDRDAPAELMRDLIHVVTKRMSA